jgi:Secretion system C-terminal sorting domain
MKNYLYFIRLSVAILITVHQTQCGNCQTLLNENFNYPSGALLTANGWNAHSSAGVNSVAVSSQGLVFPGYPSSDIGLAALLSNNGEDVNKTFTSITSGTVFCAFLVQVNVIANGYFLHFANSTLGIQKGKVFINGTDNSYNIGLSMGTADTVYTIGSPFLIGKTYLLVLKYSIVEGVNNDEIGLYIITGSIPGTEPAIPTIGPLTDGKTDINNISAVALRQYSSKQNILVDGIRVATKWEDAVSVTTGIEDRNLKDNPVIYPIPVSSELIISKASEAQSLEIFNLTGSIILSKKLDGFDIVKIPVNDLTSGLYIVRLKTANGYKIMKFIKS